MSDTGKSFQEVIISNQKSIELKKKEIEQQKQQIVNFFKLVHEVFTEVKAEMEKANISADIIHEFASDLSIFLIIDNGENFTYLIYLTTNPSPGYRIRAAFTDPIGDLYQYDSLLTDSTQWNSLHVDKKAIRKKFDKTFGRDTDDHSIIFEKKYTAKELQEKELKKMSTTDSTVSQSQSNNKKVFIVHGHNEAKKWELKDFLKDLGLEPIILHQMDDRGLTIIEKFEYYAPLCNFAFVLFTPDDHFVSPSSTEEKWRARQNVIMELGWFMAKLGRANVVVLHKGAVEIPSDISGLIYLSFNEHITEASEKIRQRLKGVGLIP